MFRGSIKATRRSLRLSRHYVVDRFTLGLEIGEDGRERGISMRHQEHGLSQPAPTVASDIPALPPMSQWVNVRTLDVKGDGRTDDTAALRLAIEKHQALYLPQRNLSRVRLD